MKIFTKVVWDIESMQVIESESFEYEGPIELACGATDAQKQLQDQQASYYQTLQTQAQQEFGDASAEYKDLQSVFQPIFNAGPSQEGYSAEEKANLNSSAATGTGEAYEAAARAVAGNRAGMGGGNMALPNGVDEKQRESVATAGAEQLSNEDSQILTNDYAQGNANFNAAANGLLGATSVFNSATGAAGAANTGGSDASTTENEIAQENEAPFNAVVGALGGIAGAATGAEIMK